MTSSNDIPNKYWNKIMNNVRQSAKGGSYGTSRLGQLVNEKREFTPYEITISPQDLREMWDLQEGRCYWMGGYMLIEDLFIPHSPFAPSVDRKDSNGGYHRDNIVLATRLANKGRGCYDDPNFKTKLDNLINSSINRS
jgi:hypothetical protein